MYRLAVDGADDTEHLLQYPETDFLFFFLVEAQPTGRQPHVVD